MATIAEVEKLAFDLPDSDRAALAAHLLRSLPSVLHDDDEGTAEALRRDAEFDADPDLGITLDQLDQRVRDRRRWCESSCIRRFTPMLTRSWTLTRGLPAKSLPTTFTLNSGS